jgi:hypothetical protein
VDSTASPPSGFGQPTAISSRPSGPASNARSIGGAAKIAELFALSMSDDLFAHLDRMASNSYGPYWVDPDMRYGLGPELNYLKILGYIEFGVDSSVPDIREMPKGDNPELSEFVRVTKQGEAFIELRKQALRGRRLRV